MALLVRKRGLGDGLIGGSAMSKEKTQLLSLISRSVIRDVYVEGKERGETPADGFLSKFVSPELKVGVGIPPSQLDSRIDDFTGFSKGGLMQKPGRNALVGVIITSSFSGDDLKNVKKKNVKLPEGLQAPVEVKGCYFESIIKEAVRYMRGDFIPHIEKKLEEMTSGYLSKKEHQTLNA
ncbi:hypothetical protein P7K49_039265 [Saguinus oedipus]|uniref:Uncharacterized protein n=1 Tax=Saguinus oedipus TaxID=9490 RepID=A0ABQ9TH25_SAGOE|nr:hypothetical protein P7K49_039265 [Saguinus oedipus]